MRDELVMELHLLRLEIAALRSDLSCLRSRQVELPPGRWMNTEEAAEILGRNRVTLQRWCSKHMKAKLPGVRYDARHAGICYEIHESLVEAWRGRDEGENGNGERETS